MSEFARLFLNEGWENLAGAPRLYLAAFGKHPGWNDHLDDIGLVTGSLVSARRILYGSGIATQIESAAWDKAGAEKTLPSFDHLILWNRPGESLVGRMWASRDGKGRALYPMVVMVHGVGQSFEWIAAEAIPALDRIATQCAATTTSGGVVTSLNDAQQALRARVSPPAEGVASADSYVGVREWTRHFSQDRVSLQRVFHHLKGQLAMFEPGSQAWFEGNGPARSRGLRLPVVPGAAPEESLNAWLSFLATQLDPAVPLLGLAPREQPWIDVIVGEPAPTDFFVLRANLLAVPLISEIPYQIDSDARDRLEPVFDELVKGQLPDFSVFNGELLGANREVADKWLARFRPGARKGLFSRLLSPGNSSTTTRFTG